LPEHIGPERQLFIDTHLIERMDGVKRSLQQPVKQPRPVLEGDMPWEHGHAIIIGNSLHYDEDDKLFKAWYDVDGGTAYATSRDGLHWEKPVLGIMAHGGSKQNNLVNRGRNLSVVKDHRESDPSRRYKGIYWGSADGGKGFPWGGKGHMLAYSPDGIHWKDSPKNPVMPLSHGLTDGQYVLGWDPRHQKYVAYMRPNTEFFNPMKRTNAWVSTENFVDWSNPISTVVPDDTDAPEDEYYRMCVATYENAYVGFIWVYHNDTKFLDQSRDTIFAFSRNGISWSKPFGAQKFAPLGPKGAWDSKVAIGCKLIPRGDELWLYYSGANIPHNIYDATKVKDLGRGSVKGWAGNVIDGEKRAYAIGLAKLRRDGFVAVAPERGEGALTTKAVTFMGSKLHVNVTGAKGRLEVEVLDRYAKPIPGYTRAECTPISADSTDYVVKWQGRDLVHATDRPEDAGGSNWNAFKYKLRQPVSLRFHLKDASLYSFWVD